jgi:hypothetical protein
VVAPAIPLPAQVVEEPLEGVRVPEEGVDAKAGKTRAPERATRTNSLSFKFEGIALLSGSADTVGPKVASPSRFSMAKKLLCRLPY